MTPSEKKTDPIISKKTDYPSSRKDEKENHVRSNQETPECKKLSCDVTNYSSYCFNCRQKYSIQNIFNNNVSCLNIISFRLL